MEDQIYVMALVLKYFYIIETCNFTRAVFSCVVADDIVCKADHHVVLVKEKRLSYAESRSTRPTYSTETPPGHVLFYVTSHPDVDKSKASQIWV